MTKRTKRILVLGLAAVVVGWWWAATREREPSYNGRSLSFWLAQYSGNGRSVVSYAEAAESEVAVKAIGTNALPFLVKWLRYEPGGMRRWRDQAATKLPTKIFYSRFVQEHVIESSADRQAQNAGSGFRILGPAAAPAIPDLISLTKIPNSDFAATRSIYALRQIGEPALPALAALISNSESRFKYLVIELVGEMSWDRTNLSEFRPLLITCCTDTNLHVRTAATNALDLIESNTVPSTLHP
jgi:hypothetical protein